MKKQDTSINEDEANSNEYTYEEFYWVCTLYCWLAETIFFGSCWLQQVVII